MDYDFINKKPLFLEIEKERHLISFYLFKTYFLYRSFIRPQCKLAMKLSI